MKRKIILPLVDDHPLEKNDLLKQIKETHEKNKDENLARNEQRAKTKLRRLTNHNLGKYKHKDKFVTLTFKENVIDRKYANLEFIKFIKRLRTRFQGVQYVAVIEKQKRGAIHFHVVIYNLPYIKKDELQRIWRHGFVQINQIDLFNDLGDIW